MKTIKPGKSIRGPVKWWVGLKLTCPRCQAQVQLEKEDIVNPQSDWTLIKVYCTTPNCTGSMLVKKGVGQLAPAAQSSSVLSCLGVVKSPYALAK